MQKDREWEKMDLRVYRCPLKTEIHYTRSMENGKKNF